ncbi:MAG TPA: MFS transporter, partial [Tepidisphaeraceae bacterium]|nr:MFS transporter [Tepidisphaeraceae bacterium]
MNSPEPGLRSHITLFLCTILHAFTHAYGSMFVPLYLLITADLHLSGVKQASLLVALYTLFYCICSYGAGLLADRFSRKLILGIGLLGNAIAIILIGLTRQYQLLLLWAILAGICGTLFHPAASGLVPAHYPKAPGMAIGLLGIGSGVGFFVGPEYSGWRAQVASWSWHGWQIAQWQKPCIELGIAGLIVGVIFLLIAKDVHDGAISPRSGNPAGARVSSVEIKETRAPAGLPLRGEQARAPLGCAMSIRVAVVGAVLGCRDFAGVGGLTLAGIYLQKAHGFDTKHTGAVLGTMMLLSVIVNPTLVWLTGGRKRLPALRGVLILGGAIAATVPFFSAIFALPVLCAFQTCQAGSYAISDAALLERVPARSRGRVYGLYFTLAGTLGAAGPWIMGFWTDAMGSRAAMA